MAKTREEWLEKATALLAKEFFEKRGHKLPPLEKLKVACGFPKGNIKKTIGQCWCPSHTPDDTTHMFISPILDDVEIVLATLLHEMVHASIGVKEKHGPKFKAVAKDDFGFAGKMRATVVAEGSDLQKKLWVIKDKLGDYPHSAIKLLSKGKDDGDGEGSERKWLTFVSKDEPKFNVGVHLTKVIEFGRPRDFNGKPMVAKKEEVEEMLREEHGI